MVSLIPRIHGGRNLCNSDTVKNFFPEISTFFLSSPDVQFIGFRLRGSPCHELVKIDVLKSVGATSYQFRRFFFQGFSLLNRFITLWDKTVGKKKFPRA